MRDKLNKQNVLVELAEATPLVITVKRKKFVKVRVLQVGSEVTCVAAGDIALCYNEGKIIEQGYRRARFVGEQALVALLPGRQFNDYGGEVEVKNREVI